MKKLFVFLTLFISVTASAQIYPDYLASAKDSAFQDKIRVAAYFGAKTNVANQASSVTVKRFSQVVITEITNTNPSWLLPLSFVILTVPELNGNVSITKNSTQSQINTVMNNAYAIFAKAWYNDTN